MTATLFYDGACRFCVASMERIRGLDWRGALEYVNFRGPGATAAYAGFDAARAEKELLLQTPAGEWLGGFEAFRWMAGRIPALMPLAPVMHVPGMGWLGQRAYGWVADHRYLIMGRAAST
jgi:predicted DCC family thiol-disulfide oxidoreductase YuxK